RAVLEEAVAAGVRQVVYASSIAVVGGVGGKRICADTLAVPQTPYGRSKLEAEELVHELSARHGLATTIMRPTLVYGAGMKGNPLRLFDLVSSGLPLPFGLLTEKKSFLFVGNLAVAICRIVERVTPG